MIKIGPMGEILEGEITELTETPANPPTSEAAGEGTVEQASEAKVEEVTESPTQIVPQSTDKLATLERSPREEIKRLAEAARLLREILDKHPELKPTIPGRGEFYSYGAWQFLGAVLGFFATIERIEEIRGQNNELIGFRALARVYRRDGTLVTAAWGQADINEKIPEYEYATDPRTRQRIRASLKGYKPRFENSSYHDILAIAQTRAARNALRMALQAITVLADWNPEEE